MNDPCPRQVQSSVVRQSQDNSHPKSSQGGDRRKRQEADTKNSEDPTSPLILYHRFVRLNPRYDQDETLRLLTQELDIHCRAQNQQSQSQEEASGSDTRDYPRPVTWLPAHHGGQFYALPADFSLASCACYQQGRLYGQDVSSGAAVATLLESCNMDSPSFRVLDMCCAPGQKLLALADGLEGMMRRTITTTTKDDATKGTGGESNVTIVGVDNSADRLAICRKALLKYGRPQIEQSTTPRIRLYCADGTTFGRSVSNEEQGKSSCSNGSTQLVWDSIVAQQDPDLYGRKRFNKSARKRHAQHLAAVEDLDWTGDSASSSTMIQPFDMVLVDAECSTDGSIKHVQKRQRVEWTDERMPELVNLQRRLAESGFRLLKPGGTMVYATCSLAQEQNEGVVQWLLQEMKSTAELEPVSFPDSPASVQQGSIPGTVRFWPSQDPKELTGGGFFVAKIKKTA